MTQQVLKSKKVPERKCASCNGRFPKKELVRVVRTPDGTVVVDETGKVSGRGVYLCKNKTCLRNAKKAKRLERSLETPIPEDVYTELERLFDSFSEVAT